MTAETFHYYRGRVALHAILRALHLEPGDEVIVQAYTCAAVIEPVLRLGLTPVYVDIDPTTYTMDPTSLRAAITGRTRAVIVQHTFGTPVDLAAVTAICEPAGLPLIEDCAHVTEPDERGPVGVSGVAAFYSYEWGKPVIAGVGGKAVVHDPALAAVMRGQYASYVAPPPAREAVMAAQVVAHHVVARLGVTWRLRALYRRLSALGLVVGSYQADPQASPEYGWRMTRVVRHRLARRTARARRDLPGREQVAARYRTGLARLGYPTPTGARPVPLRIPLALADKPRALRAANRRRLEMGDWFVSPVHPLTGDELATAGYRAGDCPKAEWAARHVVTFPVRAESTPADVNSAMRLLAGASAATAGSGELRIRHAPFTPGQLRAVAGMHAAEVPHGFLSSLGVPVLQMLYRHVAGSEHCALYVAESQGRPVGYICGSRDTSALFRDFLRRRWWAAGPAVLPRLLGPRRIRRALETLRYPAAPAPDLPRAEIINFVVLPEVRGQGVATLLFDQLMHWFAAQGEDAVKIVTGEQQTRAHAFYAKHGAVLQGRLSIHRGQSSRVYRYTLAGTDKKPQKTR
ncbi:MAG: GNAT family N-acetyltransferase [Actinoplanes sp.]